MNFFSPFKFGLFLFMSGAFLSIASAGMPTSAATASMQFRMGLLLAKGEGVPKNLAAATALFKQAADAGDSDAQVKLGRAYVTGSGVEKDMDSAFMWIMKSAEQGNPEAEAAIGAMYHGGELGVTKNTDEAVRWLQKAAVQGHRGASMLLSVIASNSAAARHAALPPEFALLGIAGFKTWIALFAALGIGFLGAVVLVGGLLRRNSNRKNPPDDSEPDAE